MYEWESRKRKPWKWLGLIAVLAIMGGVVVLAQPQATAPQSLREIVAVPNGGAKVTQPGAVLLSKQVQPVTTGDQGRGVTVLAPGVTVADMVFQPGSDDSLGLVGDCRGALVTGCTFPLAYFGTNNPSKALILYTNAANSATPGPMYGADAGYAGTFIRNNFEGGSIRIRDGVWRFEGGSIGIGQLYGIDMIDPCRANIVGVDFRTIPKPADATYMAGVPIRVLRHSGGKYYTTSLRSRLYIANCTIDGRPATASEICPGVPSYVFRSTPN